MNKKYLSLSLVLLAIAILLSATGIASGAHVIRIWEPIITYDESGWDTPYMSPELMDMYPHDNWMPHGDDWRITTERPPCMSCGWTMDTFRPSGRFLFERGR